ncbi:unnamed protein product [Adineta steineri]|uniref:Uncharacterized protein n=1 Tax=Adineta steineri TaxID=433720 RepID=A0A818MKI9_9BILA|nr:unnamed protein product [Adineta steineri]CAF3590827.1 unnamed protein product [Adineta steineri]
MVRVWHQCDQKVLTTTNIDPYSDIDALKQKVFGTADVGQYQTTYNGKQLKPWVKVPQDTADYMPVVFIKILNVPPSLTGTTPLEDTRYKRAIQSSNDYYDTTYTNAPSSTSYATPKPVSNQTPGIKQSTTIHNKSEACEMTAQQANSPPTYMSLFQPSAPHQPIDNQASHIEPQKIVPPVTREEFRCEGRRCAKCYKCCDWRFTGDQDQWNWVCNYKKWKVVDWSRWVYGDYKLLTKRNGAKCRFLGLLLVSALDHVYFCDKH